MGVRGAVTLITSIVLLLPLLLPILAVSTMLSVGLEARSREQTLLAQLGAHRAVASAPAIGEGLMIGAVAAIVALLGAKALGRDVSPSIVTGPVVLIGLVAGVIVAIAAQRRATDWCASVAQWCGARGDCGRGAWRRPLRRGHSESQRPADPFGTPRSSALGLLSSHSQWTSAVATGRSAARAASPARGAFDGCRHPRRVIGLASRGRVRHNRQVDRHRRAVRAAHRGPARTGDLRKADSCRRQGGGRPRESGPHLSPRHPGEGRARDDPGALDPDILPQLWALVFIADSHDVIDRRQADREPPRGDVGFPNSDALSLPWSSHYAPLDVSEHRQVGQSSAPTFVLVTPAVAAANRLHSTDAVAWMVRTTAIYRFRAPHLARLRADGFDGSACQSVSTTARIVRRVAFARSWCSGPCTDRRGRGGVAAGVRPTTSHRRSGRVGWLAAAGVGSTVITIALLGTVGTLASGSSWSGVPDALSEQRWALLTVLLAPVAAALVAFVVFASRRTPEISWWKRGDDRTRTGE